MHGAAQLLEGLQYLVVREELRERRKVCVREIEGMRNSDDRSGVGLKGLVLSIGEGTVFGDSKSSPAA